MKMEPEIIIALIATSGCFSMMYEITAANTAMELKAPIVFPVGFELQCGQ